PVDRVVHIAEVALFLLTHPGQLRHSPDDAREEVPLRRNDLAHPDEQQLNLEYLLQLRIVRVQEDLVLELVDTIVELGQDGKEAVNESVDDLVEQEWRILNGVLALAVALADLGEGGRVVPVNRDQ